MRSACVSRWQSGASRESSSCVHRVRREHRRKLQFSEFGKKRKSGIVGATQRKLRLDPISITDREDQSIQTSSTSPVGCRARFRLYQPRVSVYRLAKNHLLRKGGVANLGPVGAPWTRERTPHGHTHTYTRTCESTFTLILVCPEGGFLSRKSLWLRFEVRFWC